jgi:hypothetical protein
MGIPVVDTVCTNNTEVSLRGQEAPGTFLFGSSQLVEKTLKYQSIKRLMQQKDL